MRRWIMILLMVVLPSQYVWAAAAQYCGHETQGTVSHFGHHEHQHKAAGGEIEDEKGSVAHPDCSSCHFPSSPSVPAAFALPELPGLAEVVAYHPTYYLSRIPTAIERPQRLTNLLPRDSAGFVNASS